MRLFEIENNLEFRVTKRFLKKLGTYIKSYSGVKEAFRAFCSAKLKNQSFGKKDGPYTGGLLKGLLHAHLIHGKVIITYDIKSNVIYLYDIDEHTAYESQNAQRNLASFVASLGAQDYMPMSISGEEEKLSDEQKKDISEFLFQACASDPEIIKEALSGDFSTLKYFLEEIASFDLILKEFGGQNGFISYLKTIAKNYGMK